MNPTEEFKISAVPAGLIDYIWDDVAPLLQRVEDKAPDDIHSPTVKRELEAGNKMLITITREQTLLAINVLDVRTLDSGTKVLYIPITAGDEMDLWLDRFLEVAIDAAKAYHCTELRGMAVRKGWLTKLKPYGWEEMFTTIRCKIGE